MSDDLLTHTLRVIQQCLSARGLPAQQVAPVLRAVDTEMRAIFGGDRAYVRAHGHALRDRAICEEYASGHGVATLAHRYTLTVRRVRQILARNPAISHYNAASKG